MISILKKIFLLIKIFVFIIEKEKVIEWYFFAPSAVNDLDSHVIRMEGVLVF